jgi:hypothetical protein
MYQLVEDVFFQLDEQRVTQALLLSLHDVARLNRYTLYWNVQLWSTFPHPDFFPALVPVLNHPMADIRMATAYALTQYEAATIRPILKLQLAVEDGADIAGTICEILEDL